MPTTIYDERFSAVQALVAPAARAKGGAPSRAPGVFPLVTEEGVLINPTLPRIKPTPAVEGLIMVLARAGCAFQATMYGLRAETTQGALCMVLTGKPREGDGIYIFGSQSRPVNAASVHACLQTGEVGTAFAGWTVTQDKTGVRIHPKAADLDKPALLALALADLIEAGVARPCGRRQASGNALPPEGSIGDLAAELA